MSRVSRTADLSEPVLAALSEMPGSKSPDIADRIGADKIAVRDTLVKLEKAGQTAREGATRGTRWYLAGQVGSRPDEAAPAAKRARGASKRARPKGNGRKPSVLEQHRDVLGQLPDADVAKLAGVSREAVRLFRTRHGIASAQSGGKAAPARRAAADSAPRVAAEPAPRPAAEAAPRAEVRAEPRAAEAPAGVRSTCWKVEIEGADTLYVIGDSIVDAARAVVGAGKITAIERLGQALR